jgi:3-methyladenine DNA glycosylase AlkD
LSKTPEQFAAAVEAAFAPHADPETARGMERYLLNRYAFLGLPAPVRRSAVKPLMAQAVETPEHLLGIARALWGKPQREYRYVAIDLLMRHYRLLSVAHLGTLRALMELDAWWETVDGMSGVISAVLHDSKLISDEGPQTMDEWIRDSNFWVRRVAMMHQRGWQLDTDTVRLFNYAELLADEKEFFIRKAIGWALRDYARWDGASVRAFVDSHRSALSPLTVREAVKRL